MSKGKGLNKILEDLLVAPYRPQGAVINDEEKQRIGVAEADILKLVASEKEIERIIWNNCESVLGKDTIYLKPYKASKQIYTFIIEKLTKAPEPLERDGKDILKSEAESE